MPLVKLKAILRYFCTYTNPELLGKTKLMKLFYFVDFGHVKKYGMPITFDSYVHLERGPIPSNILNLVNSVIDFGEVATLADTISIDISPGMGLQKIKCYKEFSEKDKEIFTGRELETLEKICKLYKDISTKNIVDLSHKESAWINTNEGGNIPYTLAALDKDCQISEEDIHLLVNSV